MKRDNEMCESDSSSNGMIATINAFGDDLNNSQKTWRWNRFTENALAIAETYLFSHIRAKLNSRFVMVRLGKIYTIIAKCVNSSLTRTPVVLIHGFAGGVGLWAQNIDVVAENRVAYAFDLPGFGRSSRPIFERDPALIELQYVQAFEDWRKALQIDKMVIIAHSFGAYLASSYALEHPERVRHLVLVDPWGFPEKPSNTPRTSNPAWIRAVARAFSLLYPLTPIRLAGPYGSFLIKKVRPDLSSRYQCGNPDAIYEYIYQCNAQKPTGEIAFTDISFSFGWAKRPMIERIVDLCKDTPVTFIYGSKSWIDSASGFEVQEERPESYVDVQVIIGAGHHVYADRRDVFNNAIREILRKVDTSNDLRLNRLDKVVFTPGISATLRDM